MKLKTVSTYQSVRFNNRDERHFDPRIDRFKGIQLTYRQDLGVVEISLADTDTVLVFPTNVSYVVPETAEQPVAKKAKEAK